MTGQDIPEEMVETCTQALRDAGFVYPDDDTVPTFFLDNRHDGRIDMWVPARDAVVAVLSAALAGRQVVDLPEPAQTLDAQQPGRRAHTVFDVDSYVVTALAMEQGPRVNVRGGPMLWADEAERRGAALIAAAREARRLAAGSGSGED